MINKTFAIDFIRQLIEQTMLEEHIKDKNYIGGINQVNLMSFYEQLAKEEEVNRFVECYRDITDQQNRMGLILNGVILAPENPTITNISSALIIPLTFTASFRCRLEDRDSALNTLNHMVELLKGRKHDIAEFDNGKLFKVGTIANQVSGSPTLKNGDFLGVNTSGLAVDNFIPHVINELANIGVVDQGILHYPQWYYYANVGTNGELLLKVACKTTSGGSWANIVDESAYPDIIFPSEHNDFTRYQVSISFDNVRCDEPRTLNSNDYCNISFGGSATVTTHNIMFGNEITKVGVSKLKVVGATDYEYASNQYWLEPLELPNSNNPNTQLNQIVSNGFLTNDHTDNATPTIQYAFIMDKEIPLLNQWYKYSRYGTNGLGANVVSPNTIYQITEYSSCWGEVEENTFLAKIVDSIDIENTEGDVLTIKVPMKLQG